MEMDKKRKIIWKIIKLRHGKQEEIINE